MDIKKSIFLSFISLSVLLLAGCETPLSQFEVQRPARLTVPPKVKKVFIKRSFVKGTNDHLGIRTQVLSELARELNRLGRFQVSIVDDVDENAIDREKESIAVIQGEVISGGEVDKGRLTETATCKGGIAGRAISAGSAVATNKAITFDSAAFVCQKGDIATAAVEGAATQALALAGFNIAPPVNGVVRVYDYKNVSLFAQTNLSFTIIGNTRETIAIRADASSFGRHVVLKGTHRNVAEARPNPVTNILIRKTQTPIVPIAIREAAVVDRSQPPRVYYNLDRLPLPTIRDIPPKEKKEVTNKLVKNTIESFIRTVSPYKSVISTEIATGGSADVESLLRSSKWQEARDKIEKISQNNRAAADWYNLGLTFEGGAISVEDYEDARRFYITALEKDTGNKLYAAGIGRMERRLTEARLLKEQTK